jgi:hypothetical protein
MDLQTLRAVVDCLIPADDFPGAYEAGVCDYLLRLFQTDMVEQSDFFRAGIELIDAESQRRFNAPFVALTRDQQTVTLHAIESGNVATAWTIPPPRFFEMLVNTCAEGYYSDPQQGGNRGSVSWVMTGFDERAES